MTSENYTGDPMVAQEVVFGHFQQKFISAFFEMEAAVGRLDSYKTHFVGGEPAHPWVKESIWSLAQLVGAASMNDVGYNALNAEICRQIGVELPLPVAKERIETSECETELRPVDSPVSGFVYIAKNQAFPSFLKIGMTTRGVEKRLDELSKSTSSPCRFELVRGFFSEDVAAAEASVHSSLANFRVSQSKEFFAVSEDVAIKACESAIERGAV